MNTNINVENAENAIIAGRDVNVYHQIPGKSGSSENFHELGKSLFRFSAVTMAVCGMINKVDPGESMQNLSLSLTQFTITHWSQLFSLNESAFLQLFAR